MNTYGITFTRFLAAFIVVLFHFGANIPPFNNEYFIDFFLSKGDSAVSYFFVLSGFIMAIAYRKKVDYLNFYRNRIARILPNYFLAIIIFLIIARVFIPIEGFLNFFLIHAWFPQYALSINFPDWTISVEIFFYALFPFLVNTIYLRYTLKTLVLWVLGIWVFFQLFFFLIGSFSFYQPFPSLEHAFIFRFPFFHLSEFLIGNLSGMILFKYWKKLKHINGDLLIVISFVGSILFLMMPIPQLSYHNGIMSLFFIGIIWGLSFENSLIAKGFRNKYLVLLGELSFGFYLFQYPVHLGVTKVFYKLGLGDYTVALFYTFLFLLLLFSYWNYRFFEVPMKNWIRKKA